MKVQFFIALFSFLFLSSFHQAHRHHTLCFPENDMKFPESGRTSGGLSRTEFDLVLDEFQAVMQFEVNSVEGGAKLVIQRLWNNDSVNAYAVPFGIYKQLTFFGGLARHPEMTADALRLVACHELGHHLAGRPYWPERDSMTGKDIEGTESWAASEGQSDYYASLKCFRHLVIEGQKSNLEIAASSLAKYPAAEVSYAKTECAKSFSDSQDQEICLRSSMAGYTAGLIFRGFNAAPISFKTPSKAVVTKTDPAHPRGQCRTDTYFQGALCDVSYRKSIFKDDPNYNTCNETSGHTVGLRPYCWYKPS